MSLLARSPDWVKRIYWWFHAGILRRIKWWFQRRIRGWDDRNLWSLDSALFQWFLPQLKAFRNMDRMCAGPIKGWGTSKGGEPDTFTEEEWNAILDEMIYTIEFIIGEDWPMKGYHTEYHRVMKGYGLFVKYLGALWD